MTILKICLDSRINRINCLFSEENKSEARLAEVVRTQIKLQLLFFSSVTHAFRVVFGITQLYSFAANRWTTDNYRKHRVKLDDRNVLSLLAVLTARKVRGKRRVQRARGRVGMRSGKIWWSRLRVWRIVAQAARIVVLLEYSFSKKTRANVHVRHVRAAALDWRNDSEVRSYASQDRARSLKRTYVRTCTQRRVCACTCVWLTRVCWDVKDVCDTSSVWEQLKRTEAMAERGSVFIVVTETASECVFAVYTVFAKKVLMLNTSFLFYPAQSAGTWLTFRSLHRASTCARRKCVTRWEKEKNGRSM